VNPDEGIAGAPMTISGSHLLRTRMSSSLGRLRNATWLVQSQPDTVNYLGRADTVFAVVLGRHPPMPVALSACRSKRPRTGGLHDIYAVVKA